MDPLHDDCINRLVRGIPVIKNVFFAAHHFIFASIFVTSV